MLQLIRGDRFAKQVALVRGTALQAKKCQLVASLQSFGHDVKLEGATHADDMRDLAVLRQIRMRGHIAS